MNAEPVMQPAIRSSFAAGRVVVVAPPDGAYAAPVETPTAPPEAEMGSGPRALHSL